MIRAGGLQLNTDVGGDALDVAHQAGGVLEDVVVDALDDVTHWAAGLVEDYGVGVIDMAAAVGCRFPEVAANVETGGDQAQVMSGLARGHRAAQLQSRSGYSPARISARMLSITTGRSSR